MKLPRTICLSLALLIATSTPLQASGRLLSTLYALSCGTTFVGILMCAGDTQKTEDCIIESWLIPYNAPDYRERKEALLKKYQERKNLTLGGKIFLTGIAGLVASYVLMLASKTY